jgi:hypothetical protein
VRLVFTCLEKDSGGGGNSHNNTARTASTRNSDYSKKNHPRGGGEEPSADFTVTAIATLIPPATRSSTPLPVHSNADAENEDDNDAAEGEQPAILAAEEAPPASVLVCSDLDLSEFQASAGRALFEMRCQVSLNGQDFSSLKSVQTNAHRHRSVTHYSSADGLGNIQTESHDNNTPVLPTTTLVYAFTPDSLQPACLSISRFVSNPPSQQQEHEAEPLSITVRGRSFLPASRLPKGARVVATLSPQLADITWEHGFTSQLTNESASALFELANVFYNVRCDSSSALSLSVDSETVGNLQSLITAINNLAGGHSLSHGVETFPPDEEGDFSAAAAAAVAPLPQSLSILPIQLDFAMLLADGSILPLNTYSADFPPLRLNLYKDLPLQIVPNCAASATRTPQPFSLLVSRPMAGLSAGAGTSTVTVSDGLPLYSEDIVVAVYVPLPGCGEFGDATGSAPPSLSDFYPPLILPQSEVRLCPFTAVVESPDPETGTHDEAPGTPKFLLQFSLPGLSDLVATVSSGGAGGLPPCVFLSAWLDGRTPSASSTWSKLLYLGSLIEDCAVSPAPPKTGFLPGSSVSLDLHPFCPPPSLLHPSLLRLPAQQEELEQGTGVEVDADGVVTARTDVSALQSEPMALAPRTQQYVVRIRGAPSEECPEGASLIIEGRLSHPVGTAYTSTIAFEIPEAVKSQHGMVPVQKTPKDKSMYFVDVSFDGGISFDVAEHPLLFLK